MKSTYLLFTLCSLATISIFSGCKKKGCTDSESYSYDSDAKEDDGSCKYYYGGKTMGQLDVGSEVDLNSLFDVYVDGNSIGLLSYYFPQGLSCGNPQAVGGIFASGSHVVRAVGSGGSPVRQGTVYLAAQDCKVVLIENLALVGGGGSPGYNCSGGGCYSVTDGAQYSSYSQCQASCGGSSAGYVCSSGSCVSVGSGAQYGTYSECQASCGSGGSAGYSCSSGSCYQVSSGADYTSLSACEANCGGGGSVGSITFWCIQDLNCGNIYVNLISYGSGTISSYYSAQPNCGSSGCANFSNLAFGAYSYSATSDNGCTWSGNVMIDASCQMIQLTL